MDTENKSEVRTDNTVIFYITVNGLNLAERLKGLYPDAKILKFKSEIVPVIWNECRNLVFIMAAGIVVRTIAPLIKDKRKDPAIVVLDEKGKYAVSLLSGHLGGGNELATSIAAYLGGEAVITTASDVNNMTSIDLWARDNNLIVEDWHALPQICTRLINNGILRVYIEQNTDIKLSEEFIRVAEPRFADVIITNKKEIDLNDKKQTICQLYLHPRNLVIGIGCNRGTSAEEIEGSVKRVLDEYNLSFLSVKSIATIDIKGNEPGLVAFAKKYDLHIDTYTPDELNSVACKAEDIEKSDVVFNATGSYAVAEPAALLGAQGGLRPPCETPDKTMGNSRPKLLVSKQKIGNVTVTIAEQKSEARSQKLPPHPPLAKGGLRGGSRIYIVGTGPGGIEHITPYAQDAIRKSDVIVGYGTYLDLIQELIKDKEVVSTGMTQEIDRCKKAVEIALSGKTVSVISGGDPGIYAMAGLVFEILKDRDELCVMGNELKANNTSHITHHALRITVEVIPGISALNACAARLGAPLMHDFAVISLSDRLTPWDLIEKRLTAAAMSDFVTVLYNPKSMGRPKHINKVRAIFLRHRSTETPVGIVKGAMRENERVIITNLRDMLNYDIDMQTTVIIGNSQTFTWNNYMITPRGYERKLKVQS